jgi:hypothetical protein
MYIGGISRKKVELLVGEQVYKRRRERNTEYLYS